MYRIIALYNHHLASNEKRIASMEDEWRELLEMQELTNILIHVG